MPRPWLANDWTFHAFAIATVALGMGLLWRIAHAPFGRLLQALRDNEQRVRSHGYNTFRIKFEAFVIMGGVNIFVPPNWTVSQEVVPLLGGVHDKTRSVPSNPAQHLLVRGTVVMGGVEISN